MANDLWRTPPEVIDWVEARFGQISVDLCASKYNKVCESFFDEEFDFLNGARTLQELADEHYQGSVLWCNPPYSNPMPFVLQCSKCAYSGFGVVMLLNFDPSTKWFDLISRRASVIMPVEGGRISFLNEKGEPVRGNSKPQMLCYFAPFGRATKEAVYEPVHIKEIYNER